MGKINKGRRRFMIAAGATGGALAVGSWWLYRKRDLLIPPKSLFADPGESIFNAWIKINENGQVVVQVPRQEMGQGVVTALPMLVAEELDVDFADVSFEQAPLDGVYGNAVMFGEGVPYRPDDDSWLAHFTRLTQFKVGRVLGVQGTGGSTSVRDAWQPMRHAGATARAMLRQAGANRLSAPVSECTTANGKVVHAKTNRRVGYGELASEAAALEFPKTVSLKARKDFKILGSPQPRLDIPGKIDGSAKFGIDVQPEGMIYAAIRHNPTLGGGIIAIDDSAAKLMPGVRDILQLPATSTTSTAVVVVAEHYWQAKKALDKVEINWADGPHAEHNTDDERIRNNERLESEQGRSYDQAGNIETAFDNATQTVEANYFAPYLAHATMEPMNCTAVVYKDGRGEVWASNQMPSFVQMIFARATDLKRENISVHTPYLGGGFGRRGEADVVMQIGQIAKQFPNTPVQLIWSREQDTQHGTYRPMGQAIMRAALDSHGNLSGMESKLIGQSCTYGLVSRLLPGMESNMMKDRTLAEGMFDLPYNIANREVSQLIAEEPVPVGFWRSVGHSHNAFFAEAFIDECAEAAKQDPLRFRHQLLGNKPRHQKVLEAVAARAGWDESAPTGVGRGVALAESFGSIAAQVAEVEIADGELKVKRVTCAIDCGFAVNPDTVTAQMESGIIYGLTAALFGEITYKDGRVEQSNFPDYRMLKMVETPCIDVVILESGIEHLGGVGEPGLPPIAPAVANAIYQISGKRIRELPIRI